VSQVLGYKEFGRALLTTEDLDPVYSMLVKSGIPRRVLRRWCLAYWCYYHVGVASRIAESNNFWAAMCKAHDEKWPRGTERRHFRGESSYNAIKYMMEYGTPEHVIDDMTAGDDFATVAANVKAFPYFGPWIAFKVADMKERCLGEKCDFPISSLDIFKDPSVGAAMVRHSKTSKKPVPKKMDPLPANEVHQIVRVLLTDFRNFKAPPLFDRPVGAQEVETILCKWKSHIRGHYPVGKDSREYQHALDGWGDLAKALKPHLPVVPEEDNE